MATFETSKQAVLDRINTLASSSSTTAEDSIYLAKALREAAADIAFVWRGPWTSTYTYVLGDVVQHDGNAYICINAHVAAATFDSASGSWQTMVVGGAQWFTGNTVPANSSGEDGDWFFNTADEKIHNRQSGTWVSIADLGGSIWTSSAGVGTGGEDGDFHFNETTQEISKRSSGTWTVLADLTPLSADWNATTGSSFISNKPVLSTVATSGDFNDLSNQPTPFDPGTLGDLATLNTVPSAKIDNGAVTDAKISSMAASKLTGALPAISGAALTGMASNGAVTSNATGGNSTTDLGEWRYHQFTGSGTFNMTGTGYCEALIIGGGGGAATTDNVAGGGGGGYVFTRAELTVGAYTVTVGAGGGNSAPANAGNVGGTSSITSWPAPSTAYGGGPGNGDTQTQVSVSQVGSCGGSGKGVTSRSSQNRQISTPGQGNAAGNPVPSNNSGAPGGGGAGSQGGDSENDGGNAGNGGSGAYSDAFSQFGVLGCFSGGGGGGARQDNTGNGGYGGNGGGGYGGWDATAGSSGTSHTGGGAGGGGQGAASGAGGSGVVLIRYKRA